ncbi:MAG TPA: hypothetical protein VJ251_12485 [Stellaceae bacterium]|jgi:hypothetical protein|nr:hypothetical protein [Stellaceae bacterium]
MSDLLVQRFRHREMLEDSYDISERFVKGEHVGIRRLLITPV